MKIKNKFILGTAQFSDNYGLFGKRKLSNKCIMEILRQAKKKKIYHLDNSTDYKGSQKKIKNFGEKKWKITTKIKFTNKEFQRKTQSYLKTYILKKIILSKNKIGVKKFDTLLINNFEILSQNLKKNIYQVLKDLKKNKIINNFGFSIYNFKKLKKTVKDFCPDIIQCSYNIFDTRLYEKNLIKIIKRKKIKVHARSIFLQGLLLCDYDTIPSKFSKWRNMFDRWEEWIKLNKVSKLEACINFVINDRNIDKIIIGVKDIKELKDILKTRKNKKEYPSFFFKNDNLINPSKW